MTNVNTYSLNIEGIEVTVIKKRLKHLNLAVLSPDGRVRVSVPSRVSDDSLREYILSKMSWIKKNQLKFSSQVRLPKSVYATGEVHYFLGKRYFLNVIFSTKRPRVGVRDDEFIDLYVPENSSVLFREKVLEKWYRKEMQSLLPDLVVKWEGIVGVRSSGVGVRRMKTRWGTCYIRTRKIWLNLELMKRSLSCIEYVLMHELVHLLEKYHNENFRFLMTGFMPDWRVYKDELNNIVLK